MQRSLEVFKIPQINSWILKLTQSENLPLPLTLHSNSPVKRSDLPLNSYLVHTNSLTITLPNLFKTIYNIWSSHSHDLEDDKWGWRKVQMEELHNLYCVTLKENLLMSTATGSVSRRILFCCFWEVWKFGLSFSLVKVPCFLIDGFQHLNTRPCGVITHDITR